MIRSRSSYALTLVLTLLLAGSAVLFGLLYSGLSDSHVADDPTYADGIMTPEETMVSIGERLKEIDPHSPEAERLRQLLQKVRHKAMGHRPGTNPAEFLDALAAIKTGADGRTYEQGYREREYARAVERLDGKARSAAMVDLPWAERGPANVAGRSRAIAVAPDDPSGNTWFVATVGGGVWKTTDAGANWRNVSPDMTTYTAMTIAIAESNPRTIYVGTGMGYGRVLDVTGSGVWKSTDGGENWVQLPATVDGSIFGAINRLIVDPQDEDVVVLCANNSFAHLSANEGEFERTSGIFRSTDGGTSWDQVFDPDAVLPTDRDNRVQQVIATPGNFDVQYAAINEVGVAKSTDAGVTWQVVADNFALPADIGVPTGGWQGLSGISVRTELAVASTDPDRIYAAVDRPRGIADLYMSTNAGLSWNVVEDAGSDPNWFNAFGASGAIQGAYTAGWFDNTIAVSPYDENEVIVGGVNLYKITVSPGSRSRTTTPIAWWTLPNPQGIPFAHADHHFLVTLPNPDGTSYRIIDANDGGISYSTDNGTTWAEVGRGMGTTQFYGADKMPGADRYIGGMQDNGSWISGPDANATSPWSFATGGDGFEAVWNYGDPSKILATQQYGSVLRSVDTGQTWSAVPAGRVGGGQFITKLANSKADPDMVYTIGPGGVGRSDDFGANWTQLAIPQNWIGYRPFSNIEASVADPYVVWITSKLTVDRATGTSGGVHVSTDGALSFVDVTANLPSDLTEPSGIATHPTDRETAWLLFSTPGTPKVLRTTDLGQSWDDLSGFADGNGTSDRGFPDVGVFSMVVMPYDTDIMWVGTEIGLFASEDGGQSWSYADNGFPRVTAFELKIVDDQVVAATYGRGVFSVTLPELAGYRPPEVPLIPQLDKLAFRPDGMIEIVVDRRSPYDSTAVRIDGIPIEIFGANSGPDVQTILVEAENEGRISVDVVALADGRQLPTAPRSLDLFPASPIASWMADFEQPADTASLFRTAGFGAAQPTGFSSAALHTPHPYPNQSSITATIENPIIVAENVNEAIVRFDEVVLVEQGTGPWPGTNFFDYCIVEATSDGCIWQPLVSGYDSQQRATWSARYVQGLDGAGNSTTSGDETLYISKTIQLQPTFNAGDTIFLRWRLETDPAAVAWGWAIDNVEVQPSSTGVETGGDRWWRLDLW